MHRARKRNWLLMPREPAVIDELRWYFEQARTHPAPSHCDDVDDRFYNARDARFTALYMKLAPLEEHLRAAGASEPPRPYNRALMADRDPREVNA